MKRYYAYTRVSTRKQGEQGVSLKEQRDAITAYAQRNRLGIAEWFEEVLTAAKSGRPVFTRMLKELKASKAQGLIIHKIDRSARNLRDWSDLGELIDAGITVHFANESLDLRSRGGRLSADIQAVVAADYIRNLREETVKGLRGRLRQGLLPLPAPVGYQNAGKGKAKTIDPFTGPLIREAFHLYAAGSETLDSLSKKLHRLGLRNTANGLVDRNGLSRVFNNPFYAGLIRIKKTGETFQGVHEPLVKMTVFQAVQDRLAGKIRSRSWSHDFLFRGLFRCAICNRLLTGERQKGYVYYRCHTRDCITRGFREEILERAVLSSWAFFSLPLEHEERLMRALRSVVTEEEGTQSNRSKELALLAAAARSRHDRLVDGFLDGLIDKETFQRRKRALLESERADQQALTSDEPTSEAKEYLLSQWFEQASVAQRSYEKADPFMRREMVVRLSSNRIVSGNNVVVEPYLPLFTKHTDAIVSSGCPSRAQVRTGPPQKNLAEFTDDELLALVRRLWNWAGEELKRLGGREKAA